MFDDITIRNTELDNPADRASLRGRSHGEEQGRPIETLLDHYGLGEEGANGGKGTATKHTNWLRIQQGVRTRFQCLMQNETVMNNANGLNTRLALNNNIWKEFVKGQS